MEGKEAAVITVYIDDSGTAPNQQIAIASALVVESKRIASLDQEFSILAQEEGFSYFHTAECAAGNSKSAFAGWDCERKRRVCSRVRQIAMKYGVNACSIAIERNAYDEIVPAAIRSEGGRFHYTWAVGYLIEMLDHWAAAAKTGVPLEYVFDWMDDKAQKDAKAEIVTVMARAEDRRPGFYKGHYSFARCKETRALQCADILAWTCYQQALFALVHTPLKGIAQEGFAEFGSYYGGIWLSAIVQTREQLKQWVAGKLCEEESTC